MVGPVASLYASARDRSGRHSIRSVKQKSAVVRKVAIERVDITPNVRTRKHSEFFVGKLKESKVYCGYKMVGLKRVRD